MAEIHAMDVNTARPIRFWQLIVPLIGTVAGLVLLAFLGGIAAGIIAGREVTPQEVTDYLTRPGMTYITLQVFLAAIYLVGLIALRWTLGGVGRTHMIADYTPTSSGWIAFGLVAGVALVIAVGLITGALAESGVEFQQGEAERAVMPKSIGQLLMAVATIVIAGPYFEELYFRGALLSWLRGKIGLVAAVVIGSVLFALAHGQFLTAPVPQGWIATGLLAMVGMAASIIAWRSGSLWPAFAMHAAFNGTMIALAMLMPETAR